MKVHFYGRLADSLGPDIEVKFPHSCSIADVRQRLASEYPHAAETLENHRVRACIGDMIVPESHRVQPDETVEFLPPVSGG